jgi:hypothetical protein
MTNEITAKQMAQDVNDSAALSYRQSNRCCPVRFSNLFLTCHVQQLDVTKCQATS